MASMSRYKPVGWRGDSRGHALAARGIKLYARKQSLEDPVFLAAKREQDVSSAHIRDMVKANLTFPNMLKMHPTADPEDLRLRAIKAVDMKNGNQILSMMNKNGVDMSASMARASKRMDAQMKMALANPQSRSLLQEPKVRALEDAL